MNLNNLNNFLSFLQSGAGGVNDPLFKFYLFYKNWLNLNFWNKLINENTKIQKDF